MGEERIGMLVVCCLEEKSPDYESPFLKEERTPMDRIVELVSNRFACRRMETALHSSEQQYREFIALLPVGIVIGDLDENAVIHNNKRPRRVWVTRRKVKGGYEISIADNGPGISDEKKRIYMTQRGVLAESGFTRLCASHRNTMDTSASMTELQMTQAKERSSDYGYRGQILQPDNASSHGRLSMHWTVR